MSEERLRETLLALRDAQAREAVALRHSNALVDGLEGISRASSPEEALDALLQSACQTIGADVAALLVSDGEGAVRVDRATDHGLIGLGFRATGDLLRKSRRIVDPAARIAGDGPLPASLAGSLLLAPIVIPGRPAVAFICGNGHARHFQATDLVLLKRLARLAIQPMTAAELGERNALLAAVIGGSDAGMAIADARALDRPIIYANDAFYRLTGYSSDEVIGQNCRFLTAEPTHSPERVRLREHVRDARSGSFIVRNRRKDGSEFLNQLSLNVVADPDGSPRYLVVTQTDVTEARAAEQERNAARARMETALSLAKSGFLIVDTAGRVAIVNAGWTRFFPASDPDWVLGADFRACWRSHLERQGVPAAEAAELAEARLARMLAGSEPEERRGADGRVGLVAERPLPDGGAVATITDITAQKATEERLADQLYAFEVCQDGIAITDPDGCFSYMNQAHAGLFGFSTPSELNGRSWATLYRADDVAFLENHVFPVLMREGNWRGELNGLSRDGATVAQEVSLSLRPNGGLVCVTRDVSARQEAEREQVRLREQLNAAQRQEAIGQLATGIAHDFNNVLAAISGSASLLLDRADPALVPHVARIQAAAGTAASLVEKMLFLGARRPHRKAADLREIVHAASELLRASLPARNRLDIVLPQAPLVAEVDSTELTQIILNLAINARDAVQAGGGRIEIELRPMTDADRAQPVDVGRVPQGPGAALCVKDDGSGIAPDDLQRIFQPFFSRKGDQGSGLGLSVVAGILKSSGGGLRLRSHIGQGTEFHVFLPLDGAGAQANSAPAIKAEPAAKVDGSFLNGLSVLVVDDNVHVLEMLTGILEHCGAEPAPALSPADALYAFTADPDSWDLLVTDYDMPEFNGAELARSVRRIKPDIPVLLCTALAEAHRQSAAHLFDAVVGKPVAMESFVAAAQAAMAARTPRRQTCGS
jgi:two-component system, cell cycle sensor histidine kinase and response regulator CckA